MTHILSRLWHTYCPVYDTYIVPSMTHILSLHDTRRYESVISTLCENLDTLDEPDAKVGPSLSHTHKVLLSHTHTRSFSLTHTQGPSLTRTQGGSFSHTHTGHPGRTRREGGSFSLTHTQGGSFSHTHIHKVGPSLSHTQRWVRGGRGGDDGLMWVAVMMRS